MSGQSDARVRKEGFRNFAAAIRETYRHKLEQIAISKPVNYKLCLEHYVQSMLRMQGQVVDWILSRRYLLEQP